ncbi:MBL fold metallo-hydrolase [Mycolicibacterium sp.]|uniref:MBL fold metallo-hydrolase n=1 Tax=Mycolicibacterium sp. TaxID=2320850 RepID=UPI003D104D73
MSVRGHGTRVHDLGGVCLTVLHLPGHTPGSVALYEPDHRWLFIGDVVYADGGDMIDYLDGSSPADYRASIRLCWHWTSTTYSPDTARYSVPTNFTPSRSVT